MAEAKAGGGDDVSAERKRLQQLQKIYTPIDSRAYEMPADLAVLNEVPMPTWVMRIDPNNPAHMWGNQSCLHHMGKKSNKEFSSMDLGAGLSAAEIPAGVD